jgi:hypothetical protein
MLRFTSHFSRRFAASALVCGVTISGVGAATVHRYVVSQAAGSAGATAFVQTGSASSSALQGEVASSANTSIAIPFGVLGEYNAAGSTFGVGTIGISTTGYGLAGESLSNSQASILADPGGNGIGIEATTTSTSSSPAVYAEAKGSGAGASFLSDGSGDGADFTAKNGFAASFQSAATSIFANSTDASGVFAVGDADGIFGEGNNTGVFGLNQSGALPGPSAPPSTEAGVAGSSTNGVGVYGTNTSIATPGPTAVPYADSGVAGVSNTGAGVYAASSTGIGLFATSNDDALVASSQTGYSVYGISAAGSVGRLGEQSGTGVEAIGIGTNSSYPAVKISGSSSSNPDLIDAYETASGSPTITFELQGGTQNRSGVSNTRLGTDMQISGDLYIDGQVFQDCQTFPVVRTGSNASECSPVPITTNTQSSVRTSSGTDVEMYGAHEAAPTVEMAAGAELSNGRAYVAIDPHFAQTMSMRSPYRVFITPNGDSRGVFVDNRTPRGFEVRENGGGRSTLAFDYRIVGEAFAEGSRNRASLGAKSALSGNPDPHIADDLRQLRIEQAKVAASYAATQRLLAQAYAEGSRERATIAAMRKRQMQKRFTAPPIPKLLTTAAFLNH